MRATELLRLLGTQPGPLSFSSRRHSLANPTQARNRCARWPSFPGFGLPRPGEACGFRLRTSARRSRFRASRAGDAGDFAAQLQRSWPQAALVARG
jgi:hypothetical protein